MTPDIEDFLANYRIKDGDTDRSPDGDEYRLIADALASYARRLGIGVHSGKGLNAGSKVKWKSSGVYKVGEVVAVVPARSTPEDLGIKAGGGGMSRDHVSYVLRGQRLNNKGEPEGRSALYWPVVSTIEPI